MREPVGDDPAGVVDSQERNLIGDQMKLNEAFGVDGNALALITLQMAFHGSNEQDKIAPAFVALQGELQNAAKGKQGHGYKYADLASILELIREPMSNNGLAVTQYGTVIGGESYLMTRLVHTSGQWLGGVYPLEKAGMRNVNDAQQMGAAMTYARRYNLAAILGVAQEDDDAASVPKGGQQKATTKKTAPQKQQQAAQQQQQPDQQQGTQAALTALSDEQVAWARSKVSEGWAADHIIASFQKRGQLAPAVVKQLNSIANGG